ncbi:Polysaccharide biosynthesis protein [Tepidimonas sediminis]|uniref:Polysaccharide biosynthesis protein n=1 Tax=Tepidimonas sediminis TaxID=2588941 RepID=A0A554WGP9_9BURK|nr:flippase [Tepidimonas sediminis]TSE22735.1 Polysaccharide biosynthesis protein [Tepidimonas sediminis]
MNLIPGFIHRRIAHRPNLVKILDNIGWLFLDKVLRMGVGLLVGVWIARYLGPEQFGLLNFALAFTGLFAAISGMGLQGIVVRDLVRDPDGAPLTLGTAGVLMLIGGFVSYLLILVTIAYLRPDDPLARTIVAILGAMQLFRASEIAVYWFESQVQSKYTVWVQNGAFLVFAAVKVALILSHAPLTAFVWATLAEAAVVAAVLLIVLGRRGPARKKLRINAERAKTLLRDAWPLMLSGMAITIYMKIDQIMLGQMVGDEEVGIYSAAVRISEIWYFIPLIITSSIFPTIIEAKKRSEVEYNNRMQRLYDLMIVTSVGIALLTTALASRLIGILFGVNYAAAADVLVIHVWAAVFVFIGVAGSKWMLIEGCTSLNLHRTVLGAVSNVVLNILLIPYFKSQGAAVATLLSYAVAAFLADFFYNKTRDMFYMKLRSFNLYRALFYRLPA